MGKKNKRQETTSATPAETKSEAGCKEIDDKSKTVGNEMDEIFAKVKKSKIQSSEPEEPISDAKVNKSKIQSFETEPASNGRDGDFEHLKSANDASGKKKKKKSNKSGKKEWPDPAPKPRRRTNDGYAIYSEEEIGLNKKNAGGTPLCPFNCDCCF
eukprot:TRINITY_DN3996_c0_g1_i1.p1 TRINITY_DN3996_c0_g1~~TRINITY_DN3996_c0_g1_i1.p1  ORF type:complete len:156 (+),score=31.34 TRINITY_DN3996_c0_g1_i1:189-656(+)